MCAIETMVADRMARNGSLLSSLHCCSVVVVEVSSGHFPPAVIIGIAVALFLITIIVSLIAFYVVKAK